jgi:hypothetical protein
MLEQFYVPPQRKVRGRLRNAQPLLNLPQNRLHEIMGIAHVQATLDWDRIFQDRDGRSILTTWSQEGFDQAKMGVYAIVDWVLNKGRRGERFSMRMLQEKASSSGLPLSTAGIKLVVRNLAEILKDVGARTTTRGFDATGLLHFGSHERDVE